MTTFDKALYNQYESLCLTRLSPNFILRDFMFSAEAAACEHSNFPSDDVEQVIKSGKQLCTQVLEPVLEHFGRFALTFGYQNRITIERNWTDQERAAKEHSSSPHQWDRGTFGKEVYARVDILPFCVEDGQISKQDFAHWLMYNLDIDLLMQWRGSNVHCITISPRPRRVWLEWVPSGEGTDGSNKIEFMGENYWQQTFPTLPQGQQPHFYPSATNGSMRWKLDNQVQSKETFL